MKKISFLASGRGSNFKACVKNIENGYIKAKKAVLIVDKENAGAIEIARDYEMPYAFIDPKKYENREQFEKEVYSVLKKHKTDLVVAAGYMRIITPYLIGKYKNSIINIHPALLPSFPGINAQKQAFEHGVKLTGCTAHFIDSGVDTGPIIVQRSVEILDTDTVVTLSRRILAEEHRVLPLACKLFCDNKLKVAGRKVIIKK